MPGLHDAPAGARPPGAAGELPPIALAWVNLTNGGMSGGYRKYMSAMLPRLTADRRFSRVTVHSPADFPDPHLDAGVATYRWPTLEFLAGFPTLRKQLRQIRPDVVFVPTHRSVRTGGIPQVVMFRNMECALFPWGDNGVAEGLKNLARRVAARRAMRRADGVIAVSNFVSDFLRTSWNVDPRKMTTIYHGVADDTRAAVKPAALDATQPFIFTAGSIRPFRGLEDLVEAMALLPTAFHTLRLVVAGRVEGRVQNYVRRLHARIGELGLTDRITWAGTLPASQMTWCFRNCGAFVTTSRVESCPNTALEAMHHGAACVSSDNPPMPEFFGDGARYYRVTDARALAAALSQVLTDDRLRERLRRVGQARVSEFTWNRTYERTVDFVVREARRGVSPR